MICVSEGTWCFQFCGWHKEGWLEIQHSLIRTSAEIPLFLHTKTGHTKCPQQSPSKRCWSRETLGTPSGMPWPCNGFLLGGTQGWTQIPRQDLAVCSISKADMKTTLVGEERKKHPKRCWGSTCAHRDKAGGAACWDGVRVTLSSGRFPGPEEEKDTPKLWSACPDNTGVIKMHIYWNKGLLWRLVQRFTFVSWPKSVVSVQLILFVIM